ncbi:MAG: lytic murein transglycosylase, partial [Sphingopyxis sp.]|nr:lytic murein transglycosylase [Sphingopyxis sp.]
MSRIALVFARFTGMLLLERMIGRRTLIAGTALAATPAFAQSAEARFAAFLQGVRQEAARSGVDAGTLDAALGGTQEIPRVMELARNQPEFKMTWERYQELVVSNERVTRGRALLAENRAAIGRFAAPVGLPTSVVVALWGIESNYGTRLGDFEVVPA